MCLEDVWRNLWGSHATWCALLCLKSLKRNWPCGSFWYDSVDDLVFLHKVGLLQGEIFNLQSGYISINKCKPAHISQNSYSPVSFVTSISLSTCVLHVRYWYVVLTNLDSFAMAYIWCGSMCTMHEKVHVKTQSSFPSRTALGCSAIVQWGWDMRAPHAEQKRLLHGMNFGYLRLANQRPQKITDLEWSWYMMSIPFHPCENSKSMKKGTSAEIATSKQLPSVCSFGHHLSYTEMLQV